MLDFVLLKKDSEGCSQDFQHATMDNYRYYVLSLINFYLGLSLFGGKIWSTATSEGSVYLMIRSKKSLDSNG